MIHTTEYCHDVVIGKYKFLNIRESCVYALSASNDLFEFLERYLEAAGPQWIIRYTNTHIYFDLMFMCNSLPCSNCRIVYSRHSIKHNLCKDTIEEICKDLKMPHAKHTMCDGDSAKILLNACQYADNNYFAKELTTKAGIENIIVSDSTSSPMNWHIPHYQRPMVQTDIIKDKFEFRQSIIIAGDETCSNGQRITCCQFDKRNDC